MTVHVINPRLDMPVAGAKVALVERKGSGNAGIFGGSADCKEIASAMTDENGVCVFNEEKLRKKKNIVYFLALKESWGQERSYPCGGRTSGFIEKGSNSGYIVSDDDAEGDFQVIYHDLLDPSQPGDSMIISMGTVEYVNPKDGRIVGGGGGVFHDSPFHAANNPPSYPSILTIEPIRIQAWRLQRYVRKRKMGVVTVEIDTIRVMPNTTTVVDIFW